MLTRTQILESIWDSAGNFVEDNTLTVYIKRLREKLGDSANIETVRGVGYRAD
jgi:DNA-binding response OmpR family regulator